MGDCFIILIVICRHHISSELLFHGRARSGPLPGGHVSAGCRLHRPGLLHRAPVHPHATQPLQETQEGVRGGKVCCHIIVLSAISHNHGCVFLSGSAVGRRSSSTRGQRCCRGEEESFGVSASGWVHGGQPAYSTGDQEGMLSHWIIWLQTTVWQRTVCTNLSISTGLYFPTFLRFVDWLNSPTDTISENIFL